MSQIPSTTDAKNGLQTVTTSFYGLGGDASLISSIHMQWDNILVCSGITIWASNFPEVALNSAVAGDWIQLQPTAGYTAISPAGAATLGASPLIVVVPGGTAGGVFIDLGNTGAVKLMVKVVCTAQGQLRIKGNGKD